jgi:hypothetical protein
MVVHFLDHHRRFIPYFADGVPPNGPPSAPHILHGDFFLRKSIQFPDKNAIFVSVDGPASTDSDYL